ncbi:tetratricopeptide repeat protein [Pontiellaceae bacterium B12227]|nr:tetratricopeptide repeat protein [Pontiellaceae bacterium B12227]
MINWKLSFQLEGRTLITDKSILIDDCYVFADPLPPEGNKSQYRKAKAYWQLVPGRTFGFDELSLQGDDYYTGPNELALNNKYITFLLQRFPANRLYFAMTGNREETVLVYRDDKQVGLLMPYLALPPHTPALVEKAESGDAQAQYYLGKHYRSGVDIEGDPFLAVKWFISGAEQNHPRSLMELGLAHLHGSGVEPDLLRGMFFIEEAIKHGCVEAIKLRTDIIAELPPELYKEVAARLAGTHKTFTDADA